MCAVACVVHAEVHTHVAFISSSLSAVCCLCLFVHSYM